MFLLFCLTCTVKSDTNIFTRKYIFGHILFEEMVESRLGITRLGPLVQHHNNLFH